MEKRNVPRDWKQQFFEVKTIGPEPQITQGGFWKKYEPKEIKIQEETKNDRPDK